MSTNIKIYHIVHINNLPSIIADGYLYADAEMRKRQCNSVRIGMKKIKDRRMTLPLTSRPGLHVGECVPFYFCPRSPMLYIFDRRNSLDIEYQGGQEPIVHLVADLIKAVDWIEANKLRWAFTNSNAGSYYFEDFADVKELNKIDWQAVQASQWSECQDKKQAEFLVERCFPFALIDEIGVYSYSQLHAVNEIFSNYTTNMLTKIQKSWYY